MATEPWVRRRSRTSWNQELRRAVKVLYPDGEAEGFRPLVSEFFTLLEVMDRVHSGRERLPLDAGDLLRDLRGEISEGLANAVEAQRRKSTASPHHAWLATTGRRRPDVVITSNWDTLVEQAALRAGLTVHLAWPRNSAEGRAAHLEPKSVVVLKLHGSTDWGRVTDPTFASRSREWEYDRLDAPIDPSANHLRRHSRTGGEEIVRYRSVDHPIAADRTGSAFASPLMATMAAGKDTFIGDLENIWDDAYWTLSRADMLDVIGYSFPPDDLELRTLLRVSTRQPGQASLAHDIALSVCNPSPDTHDRARAFLGTGVQSSYEGAASWRMPRQ